MGISYDDAISVQEKYEDGLLENPNVTSVSVVKEIDDEGEWSGEYALQVGVLSIELYNQSLKSGSASIPGEYVVDSVTNPGKREHIKVSIVKKGKIEALSSSSSIMDKSSVVDATDVNIPLATGANNHILRHRPASCGLSIGHIGVTAGTIGLLLRYETGPYSDKAYILSNNHVLAATNLGYIGDSILQPGTHDNGSMPNDNIAKLHRWLPISFEKYNLVDVALAEVVDGKEWSKHVSPLIFKIGNPGEVIEPTIGMSVEKSGRTTEHTTGIVNSISASIKVQYLPTIRPAVFKKQIETTKMSLPGDSGSSLVHTGTRNIVGLLFAGNETASFHNPFSTVMSLLPREHVNIYPDGSKVTFPPTPPFKIIKRTYTTGSIPENTNTTTHDPRDSFQASVKALTKLGLWRYLASSEKKSVLAEATAIAATLLRHVKI